MAAKIPIWIALNIDPSQPDFLQGLDQWLKLGLISEAQVRQLCQSQLICSVSVQTAPSVQSVKDLASLDSTVISTDPVDSIPAPSRTTSPTHDFLVQALQSLMAELSVRWLLLLGVFMVVVSSGVLAATQWQNVTSVGQYGILFTYTLAFWGASIWTNRNANLRLTSQMLQVTALLLVPVNFWMMDGLNLFQSGIGWSVAAIAALILTGILVVLQRSPDSSRPILIHSIGLSWLQWGWNLAGMPLGATYLGMIATAGTLYYRDLIWASCREQLDQPSVDSQETSDAQETVPTSTPGLQTLFTPSLIAVLGGTFLLLFRAVIVRGIPLQSLGLAFGICGWLVCWLSRRALVQPWLWVGACLIIGGRLAVFNAPTPWQAIAISGLALWLLIDQLQRYWKAPALIGLFGVGLQALWPLGRLIPEFIRQQMINTCVQIAGSEGMPTALWGVTLFPYLLLWMVVAARLQRSSQAALAKLAVQMGVILGFCLTLISFGNPFLRSLNLTLSAIPLMGVVSKYPESGRLLIYSTHVISLSAIAAWIHYGFPTLNLEHWANVLLVMMAAEWLVCFLSRGTRTWQVSAWHLGLGLAGASYTLLMGSLLTDRVSQGWIALAIPLLLTALATRSSFWQSRLAVWLSTITLVFIQPLMFSAVTPRLIGLGVATGLMVVNTNQLQRTIFAAINIGFGLTFGLASVWKLSNPSTFGDWFFTLIAIAVFGVWLFWNEIRQKTGRLARVYCQAADGWAIGLQGCNLFLVTGMTALYYLYLPSASSSLLPNPYWITHWTLYPALIAALAVGYRLWKYPQELGFYGLAWSVELVSATILLCTIHQGWDFPDDQILNWLAIANLALGFLTQFAGDWWVKRFNGNYRASWHVIPLFYAGLGFLLQHREFTAFTGLYTIAAALVGIGVGRRRSSPKLLIYLSLAGVTVAAYELLLYPLLQTKGGGDGFVFLAGVGVLLSGGYLLLRRWLTSYLDLSTQELRAIAHVHWVGGSFFLFIALGNNLSNFGSVLWIGVATALASYALIQGLQYERWTYLGLAEAGATLGYLLHQTVPGELLQPWAGAISTLIAFGVSVTPWSTWGWSMKPWRQFSLVLPGVMTVLTSGTIAITSLLVVAAFYAWQAQVRGQMRLSYLSVLLADWGIWCLLDQYQWSGRMTVVALIGSSLLYVAQFDPQLRSPSDRDKRHTLRVLASSLICLTALYEFDGQLIEGLLTAGLFLGLILVGLLLRVRAFLYVGTIAFVLKVFRQLWLFIADYSLLLWAIGIVLGLVLIWIAATFEARRTQVMTLLQHWVDELRAWE